MGQRLTAYFRGILRIDVTGLSEGQHEPEWYEMLSNTSIRMIEQPKPRVKLSLL